MQSNFLKLQSSDFLKGLVMAVISGFALPILAALQTPGFSFSNLDWHQMFILAITGGLTGFSSYLVKNLFSDSSGKFLGMVG